MPELPDYFRLRAAALPWREEYDEALADADKAIKLEPKHSATNELRGMILLDLERYDDALEASTKPAS